MKRRAFFSFLATAFSWKRGWSQQSQAPSGFTIGGTIVHAGTNAPMGNMLVQIRPVEEQQDQNREVVTGPDGRFSFSNLPAGKFAVTAMKPGGAPQSYLENEGFSTALVTGPGQDPSSIVFRFHMPGTIALTLLDDNNDPVSQASIHLFLHTIDQAGMRRVVSHYSPVSHAAGRYRFSHLPPGSYLIGVAARPWFSEQRLTSFVEGSRNMVQAPHPSDPHFDVAYPFTYYSNALEYGSATPVTVTEGRETALQMNLRAVPSIHARLTSAETAPGVGANLQVFALGPESSTIPLNISAFVQNGQGELTGLAPGRYQLLISTFGVNMPERRGAATARRDIADRGSFTRKVVDLTDGIVIDMASASRIGVSGIVRVAGNKRPPNRIGVRLRDPRNGQAVQAIAGADDKLLFAEANVNAGTYQVGLTNTPEFRITAVEAKGARITGDRLIIEDNANVELSILIGPRSAIKIEGLALLGDAPAVGAMVLLLPKTPAFGAPVYRDQSDGDGSFVLRGVNAGTYLALAIDDGRDLAFGEAAVIAPYLVNALAITVNESATGAALRIPVQRRLAQAA